MAWIRESVQQVGGVGQRVHWRVHGVCGRWVAGPDGGGGCREFAAGGWWGPEGAWNLRQVGAGGQRGLFEGWLGGGVCIRWVVWAGQAGPRAKDCQADAQQRRGAKEGWVVDKARWVRPRHSYQSFFCKKRFFLQEKGFFSAACPPGRIYTDPNLPELPSHERTRVYSCLATTLANLHALDPEQLGLQGFGNPMHYCRRQVGFWGGPHDVVWVLLFRYSVSHMAVSDV